MSTHKRSWQRPVNNRERFNSESDRLFGNSVEVRRKDKGVSSRPKQSFVWDNKLGCLVEGSNTN